MPQARLVHRQAQGRARGRVARTSTPGTLWLTSAPALGKDPHWQGFVDQEKPAASHLLKQCAISAQTQRLIPPKLSRSPHPADTDDDPRFRDRYRALAPRWRC